MIERSSAGDSRPGAVPRKSSVAGGPHCADPEAIMGGQPGSTVESGEDSVHTLTTYAVAGADGLFVHREINGDAVDLVTMFELHARLVHEAAAHMSESRRQAP